MIQFEPTTDAATISRIIKRPEIWAAISEDGDGDPWDYEPKVHPQVVYVLAKDDDKVLGLLIFSIHSRICWEATIMVLPAGRGRAFEIAKAGQKWCFERGCLRLIGRVLKTNRLALKLNKAIGFKVYGVNRACVMKNGKLEDFVLFGMSKSDWLQECPESGQNAENK